jgi:hypothetical protein
MKEQFTHVDMAGTEFHDVNLRGAVFDDVNLAGAHIHNASLANVVIEDAHIVGLTIFGIDISKLIEAEFDRRDPQRVTLRAIDIYDPDQIRGVFAELDGVRTQFTSLLRATPEGHRTGHPGPDRWSAIEHLRHLVFAEDLYLNRWLLRNEEPWCCLGFLPPFLENSPEYAEVGSEPTDDLDLIVATWEALNAGMQAFVDGLTGAELRRDTSDVDFGQGTVGQVLQGLAQHELTHIRMAEAAIQDCAAQT